ncbi:MAG: nickel pincer cofactor biosynthesis protein LarC [Planctomycetota bacterium]|nr:nickel pincer cofactor biosynthesis protein LarC [Planctomycetota bacterium]
MAAKRMLYIDPFSGIAGDMLVGALLDLGLDLAQLQHELGKLDVRGYRLSARKVMRGMIAGTKFDVFVAATPGAPGDAGLPDPSDETHPPADGPRSGRSAPFGHELTMPHREASTYDGPRTEEETLYKAPKVDPSVFAETQLSAGPATDETVLSSGRCAAHDHGHDHDHSHDHAHGHSHDHDHAHSHGEAEAHAHVTYAQIRELIERSGLTPRVKERSLRAFELLAESEGRMHHMPPDEVGFHEVGAVDSIVDFVGACIGLDLLGVEEVRCGPVALGGEGGGYVDCQHGRLPVPAFATLELMKGLPIRPCPVAKELTTPTGAALLRALVRPEHFGPLPSMNVEKLGYGAGTRNDPSIPVPNLLRVAYGTLEAEAEAEAPASASAPGGGTVVECQANIDDATPEVLGYAMERLLEAGALDAFFTPVQMKKGRPGTLVTVVAPPEKQDAVLAVLFSETTTFGVRYAYKKRATLDRETERALTPWGEVRVKIGRLNGEVVSAHPEFEDCRELAKAHGVPLRDVIGAAAALYVRRPD